MKCNKVLANAIAWGVTDLLVLLLSFVSLMTLGDYELFWVSLYLLFAMTTALLSLRVRIRQVAMAGDSDTTGYWHFWCLLFEPFAILLLFLGWGYYLFVDWGTLMIGD